MTRRHDKLIPVDKLKDYYKQFFDNNFLRDLRPFKYYVKNDEPNRWAKNFRISENTPKEHEKFIELIKKDGYGFADVTAELYSCKDMKNFQNKIDKNNNPYPTKIFDRLFFDFDFDKNPRAKELKSKILLGVAKQDKKPVFDDIVEYMNELLLQEEMALQPYEDMMKLYEYLENFDIKSYPVFSGSKGFHLYIFFPDTTELPKNNINYFSTTIAETYKKSCELKTIDFAVNRDAYSRVSRLPYCLHPITFLYTSPTDINDSYEEIIHKAFEPKIQKFNISSYKKADGNKALSEHILTLNNEYMEKERELAKTKEKFKQAKNAIRKKRYNGQNFNDKKSKFNDCRELAKDFLGEPNWDYGDYITYLCPFHDDTNPSMSVYEKVFICNCFGTMNYFNFIKRIKGFKTDDEVKKFMSETAKNKKIAN